jgi:RHS repeat-associated protein
MQILHNILRFAFQLILLPAVALQSHAQNIPDGTTAPAGSSSSILPPSSYSLFALPNSITEYTPRVPITNGQNLHQYSPAAEVIRTTDYRDGFKRTIQLTQHSAVGQPSNPKNLVSLNDSRLSQELIEYLPFPSNNPGFVYNGFQASRNYYSDKYPNEGQTGYGVTFNLSNASKREALKLSPGKSQAGQLRGLTSRLQINEYNEVRLWHLDYNGRPVSTNYYSAGQLFGTLTKSAENAEELIYKDKDGRIVYKRVHLETRISGGNVLAVYAVTYFVYDEFGRLRYILPPAATDISGGSPSQAILDNYCFKYLYDADGRIVEQKLPGKAAEHSIYDHRSRKVLYQDGNLSLQGKWLFTIYDNLDRVICTGVYTTSQTLQQLQSVIDDTNIYSSTSIFYFLKGQASYGEYPSSIAGAELLTFSYYDGYEVSDPANSIFNGYSIPLQSSELQNSLGNETPSLGTRTYGLLTGSKIKIIPGAGASVAQTGDWKTSVIYYDEKARDIYKISCDYYNNNLIRWHSSASQFNFTNQLLVTKHSWYNQLSLDGKTSHTELTKHEYELHSGKISRTAHKLNVGSWTTSALFRYDDLGRIDRKVLGNYGEVQDFTYNIRSQLSGINDVYAKTGNAQGESRTFGIALYYDFGFTSPRYDGGLSGIVWRGSAQSSPMAYGYSYDKSGRLTTADFRKYEAPSGSYPAWAWRNDQTDYTVSNLRYDLSGNILSKRVRGPAFNGTPTDLDKLSYTYESNGHKLLSVFDTVTVDNGRGDFIDGNISGNDYSYDSNGNLVSDLNKQIVSITYNYFDKPEVVNFAGGKSIIYSYDATGNKVQELINGPVTEVNDYIGNAVYKNDSLQYVLTTEGRAVYNVDSQSFNEEYFVKDHLGNIRSVIDVKTHLIQQYLASYEVASANIEGLYFNLHDEVRDDKPGATSFDDLSAGRLNGGDPNRQVGTAILLHVMAGDKVQMNVNTFYEGYEHSDDTPLSIGEIVSTVASALSGGSGGFEGSETHNSGLVDRMFNESIIEPLSGIIGQNYSAEHPQAFLNYVLFDENMQIVSEGSGAFQATGKDTWTEIGTDIPLLIPQNGYLAVYLSNASYQATCTICTDVYFDQLVLRVTKGKLKEETHYYPFGLPMNALSSTASGFTVNRFKYQGNEYIKELGLNWMDFHNRQYDPQIGRFLGVDPLAASGVQSRYSPYAAMGNNPAILVDPDGLKFAYPVLLTGRAEHSRVIAAMEAEVEYKQNGRLNDMSRHLSVGGMDWGGGRSNFVRMGVLEQFAMAVHAAGGQVLVATGEAEVSRNDDFGGAGSSDGGMSGTLPEVSIIGKRSGWFSRAWKSIKSAFSGYEITASSEFSVSIGVQAGFNVNVGKSGIGLEGNALSVDLYSNQDNIDGVSNAEHNWIGKDYWMNLKQGAEASLGFGSMSAEREMQSPVGGGAFFNDKLTLEGSVGIGPIGYVHQRVIPLGGLTTNPAPVPSVSNGLQIGAGLKFLIGVDFNFNINVRKR